MSNGPMTQREKRRNVCQLTCKVLSVARIAERGEERRLVKESIEHVKLCPRCQRYILTMGYATVQDLEDIIKEQWEEADKR